AKQEPPPTAPTPPSGPVAQAPASSAPDFTNVHASPAVRRIARELGIDLNAVKGTGEKGRITKDDVKGHLTRSAAPAAGGGAVMASGGMGIPEIPAVDFSKFGPIEVKPLPRIKKISGPHLHRAWLNVPLVTHQDEADITETDKYRKELDTAGKEKGYRVTLLAFLIKAAVSALRQHPEFNSSLNPEKDTLILKRYYNIGVAVDTPEGLVVPVVKDADRKGIVEISQDLGTLSKKARDGKLGGGDMQGATFTISSLGGIGGTAFTPLVNAPEVAILGVVRSKMAPVWDGKEFQPRLMLPLSMSYDHRVIDGALAARFTRHLAHVLEDVRRLVV
ncbi:2-oxo acid dehydrogenase subunit E2, partial [Methylobacterium trifolii]